MLEKRKRGRPPKAVTNAKLAKEHGHSPRMFYYIRKLKQAGRQDLLDAWQRGEIRGIHTAMTTAFGRPPRVEKVMRLLDRCTEEEIEELVADFRERGWLRAHGIRPAREDYITIHPPKDEDEADQAVRSAE